MPEFDDTPFFTSQNYHDLDPASKNLEWYLKYFPSIKDIPVLHHNPVLAGESLPHIQHYGLSHVHMESESPSPKDQKILVGECAPSYLHSDGASKRIAATIPEMKAVFIFRDPIDRAYLNYLEQSMVIVLFPVEGSKLKNAVNINNPCTPFLVPLEQYAAGYTFEEIVAEELLILKECIARPKSKKWTEFLKCHTEEAQKSMFGYFLEPFVFSFLRSKCMQSTYSSRTVFLAASINPINSLSLLFFNNSRQAYGSAQSSSIQQCKRYLCRVELMSVIMLLILFDSANTTSMTFFTWLLEIDPPAPLLNLVVKGLYYSQLHEFVKYVPFTKILVLRTEDLYDKKSTVSTMVRLSHFLNLDPAPFTNFPVEIGADPMAPLRYGGGAGFKHVFDSTAQDEDENEDDMIESSDVDEPDFERRAGSRSSSASSPTVFSKKAVYTDPPLELSTRFRLQRVFEPFNRKLVDMFEHRQDFPGWVYDVDRG